MLSVCDAFLTFNPGTPLAVPALRGVDLDVEEGQFVTVIGTNGAGKSTLLSAIAGDVRLDKGGIYIDGQEVTNWRTEQRASMIGRVFQEPRAGTCSGLTVEENLALAASRGSRRSLRNALGRGGQRRRLADQLSRLDMGMEDRLGAMAGTLSGGQRQALSLLMATLLPMKILILDEHTAALDPGAAATVLDLSAEITGEQKLTTLMVTHSMRNSLDYGDRTIMMNGGRILLDVHGDTRKGYDVPDLLDLFKKTTGTEVEDDQLILS
ncbi:MAG: ATP-binding cassette domain-containing protein [Roseitalea sp.]|nr:ATP-binding cassette domain-containing protein [Roseitalea sp.]MBO6951605.1 ATP-binding cassette domain-containing protein [Rhizobiaceae bacterium]MBO6592549.1 ATP-binding cassette domain-containing protein [Roseitalea sp.]MBO6598804.1 ATP-binding cassette domain-containing protein [Roseitalea sp.]MBO6611250.1 ATP-binding cassette domain-containing protein [Roseitalea sp.]